MRTYASSQTLVIYTKEPCVGRVKTRLGRDIGLVAAAWWFRHTARCLIRSLRSKKWRTVVAVSPDAAVFSKEYELCDVMAQSRGSLGARLRRTFESFQGGATVVIGTDCPDVTQHHINQAFAKLGSCDLILGPASDGGYWLIGLKRGVTLPAHALKNVRWSSQYALEDTVKSFPEYFKIGYLETLVDIDTAEDFNRQNRISAK
jgi:uncharacterized protein